MQDAAEQVVARIVNASLHPWEKVKISRSQVQVFRFSWKWEGALPLRYGENA